jgi:hypothetical protein
LGGVYVKIGQAGVHGKSPLVGKTIVAQNWFFVNTFCFNHIAKE